MKYILVFKGILYNLLLYKGIAGKTSYPISSIALLAGCFTSKSVIIVSGIGLWV